MQTFLQLLKDWSAVLIPILSLLAGGGWLQYYLAVRRAKQDQFRSLLEDGLLPFEGVLRQSQMSFEGLRDDRELNNLEFHPGRLQQFYSSLPDGDPRKVLWKVKIDGLQKENQAGLALIDKFYGKILTSEFKKACDEYRYHVKQWQIMWDHFFGTGKLPESDVNVPGSLFAPKFPEGLEQALQAEIAAAKKLAG